MGNCGLYKPCLQPSFTQGPVTVRNLEKLLAPRSVALVGASPEPRTVGSIIAHNLLHGGFAGPVWLVNPRHASIDGVPCFASLDALPEAPDLVVVATPPATVPAVIAQAVARGTRAAVVITAGISGPLRQAMLDAARPCCFAHPGPELPWPASSAHRPQR
ncbi:MAG: CoA-binding protein [Hyphomicrobium sp.]|nr:CoA-binding protein [Hyphomicrobium sp.]